MTHFSNGATNTKNYGHERLRRPSVDQKQSETKRNTQGTHTGTEVVKYEDPSPLRLALLKNTMKSNTGIVPQLKVVFMGSLSIDYGLVFCDLRVVLW